MWGWLGRALYKLIGWALVPVLLGGSHRVRLLIQDEEGRFLLVKSWLSKQQWELPGGGVHKNEDVKIAAARELREEVGVALAPEDMEILGNIKVNEKKSVYEATVIHARVKAQSLAAVWPEILASGWFTTEQLPALKKPYFQKVLHLYENRKM